MDIITYALLKKKIEEGGGSSGGEPLNLDSISQGDTITDSDTCTKIRNSKTVIIRNNIVFYYVEHQVTPQYEGHLYTSFHKLNGGHYINFIENGSGLDVMSIGEVSFAMTGSTLPNGLTIERMTQAEYDALVSKDANTFYIIVENQNN